MNDKLKLPVTAVFSFLLGGVIFFPWGSSGGIVGVSNKTFSNITVEQTEPTNRALLSTGLVAKKNKIIVKKTEYHFSGYDIALSNLAIKNQLNNSSLSVESQTDIHKIIEPEKIAESTKAIITKPVIIVEYRFSSDELKVSNAIIKKQLKSYKTNSNKKRERLIVKKVKYSFDPETLLLSNSVIEKHLSRYLPDDMIDEPKIDHKNNIAEVEIAEKSETDLFVSDVSDYANESDATEIHDTDKNEKEFVKIEFSEAELKLSNLAIAKQLRSYEDVLNDNESDVATSRLVAEQEPEKIVESNSVTSTEERIKSDEYYDESELLISNSAHDDNDDEDYSKVPVKYNTKHQFRKNNLSSSNDSDYINEHDDDDEDEDDDFGSERVVFTNEPQFLTHSLDEISAIAIDENIETPDVEDIKDVSSIEEVEIIEEIEINDDGKIISSSAD